jgi:predicted phage terminase large subunit-like protein
MMLVEAKANGISLVQDLRRAGIEAHKFDPTKFGDKTQRVVLATPLIQNGLIYVPALPPDFKKLRPSAKELLRQCELFPAGESRDVVDTMTQVILYLQQNGLLNHRKNPKVVNSILRPKHGFYGVTSDDYNTW